MHAGGGGVVADGRRDGRHPVGHGVEGGRLQSHEGRHVPRHRTAQNTGEHATRRLGTCGLGGRRVPYGGRRDDDLAIVQDTQRPQHGDDQRRHAPEGERRAPSAPHLRERRGQQSGCGAAGGDATGVDAGRHRDMAGVVTFRDYRNQNVADGDGGSEHHRAQPDADAAAERAGEIARRDAQQGQQNRHVDADAACKERDQRADRGEGDQRNRRQYALHALTPRKVGSHLGEDRPDGGDGGPQIQRYEEDQSHPQSGGGPVVHQHVSF